MSSAGAGGRLAGAWLTLTFAALCPAAAGRLPMAHFYYVNEPSSFESLQSHAGRIDLVSPQWLGVDGSGRLESTVDPAVVRWAAERRIRLMPLLVNRGFHPSAARALIERQSQVLGSVLETAAANRFHGIQLDVENVPEEDRGRYADLVRAFAKQLHKRRMKLSVAVPAPLGPVWIPAPPGGPSLWLWPPNEHALGFDYEAIGKAADFVSLMTYDQHASPEDPGAVAGLPWVEACVRKALEWIPARKLMLGLPLYYRQWTGKSVAEGPYGEAREAAERRGATIEMDVVEREKTYRFREDDADGVVWLQDRETLRERAELVKKHGLAGFSAWRLGQEDPAIWDEGFWVSR